MAKEKFKVFVMMALLIGSLFCAPGEGKAQDDFPGVPIANPGFPPGPLPGVPPLPTPGNANGWRTKWGPQKLWNVRKGDTVIVDQVMNCSYCYWHYAIAIIMPTASNAQNLQLISGDQNGGWDHGQAGSWCIRCTWSFTAGDDFPDMALIYYGSGDFYAVLEVQEVIPAPQPPQRQVVPQWKKDEAHAKAAKQRAWSRGLGVLGAATCGYLPWEVCTAIVLMAGAFDADADRLAAVDPWDDYYQYPWDPQYHWYVPSWFNPLPEDGSAGWMGMAPYINGYAWNATVVDGLNEMAIVSINRSNSAWQVGDYGSSDMQADRANWAIQTAGAYYGNVANSMWAFQWFFANFWDPYFDVGSGEKYLSESVGEMAQSYAELAWTFQQ